MRKLLLFLFVVALAATAHAESLEDVLADLDESELEGSELEFPFTMIMGEEVTGINISTDDGLVQLTVITEDSTITDFEKNAYPDEPTMTVVTSQEVLEDIFSQEEEERTQALLDAIDNDDIKVRKSSTLGNIWLGFLQNVVLTIVGWFI